MTKKTRTTEGIVKQWERENNMTLTDITCHAVLPTRKDNQTDAEMWEDSILEASEAKAKYAIHSMFGCATVYEEPDASYFVLPDSTVLMFPKAFGEISSWTKQEMVAANTDGGYTTVIQAIWGS